MSVFARLVEHELRTGVMWRMKASILKKMTAGGFFI